MKTIRAFLTLVSVFTILGCQNKRNNNSVVRKTTLLLDSVLLNSEFESFSVGIVDNDKEYKLHRGTLSNHQKPTDETLYEIASLTKTFTGTLLARAINEKKVALDDDIRTHFKERFSNLVYEDHAITIRHLVTHQSGLPPMFPDIEDLFQNSNWDDLPFIINELQKDFSKDDFFAELRKVKLDTIPGFKFSYSNSGANLIGYLLEAKYGKTYKELLKEKILHPLRMRNTSISLDSIDMKKVAFGRNLNKLKMPLRVDKRMNADGGIISSTKDMIKYMRFHLDETNEDIEKAHQELWDGKYGDFDVGFFWQINKNGDAPDLFFQNGGAFGTSSWLSIIPESNIGVFIVTNVSGQNVHEKLSEMVNIIIEEIKQSRFE